MTDFRAQNDLAAFEASPLATSDANSPVQLQCQLCDAARLLDCTSVSIIESFGVHGPEADAASADAAVPHGVQNNCIYGAHDDGQDGGCAEAMHQVHTNRRFPSFKTVLGINSNTTTLKLNCHSLDNHD